MRILQQFKGRLTPAQAAHGINAAVANAKRLAEDAKLLLEAKRYPSASSLAILSLEELGKRSILRALLTAPSDVEIQDCWQRYRRHTQKNYLALLPDRLRGGAKHLQDFGDLFLKGGESDRATVDTIKQLGFYTDCCGTAHWSTPSEVVNEKVASELVSLVWALSEAQESTTIQELELWQLHMSTGLTRQNLLNWCSAMVLTGLKESSYVDEMRSFTGPEMDTELAIL